MMNNLYIINGNVYLDGKFEKKNILIKDGIISEINSDTKDLEMPIYDAKGQYVIPGFIDIHTHGAVNIDVNGADTEDLEKISVFFAKQGTTTWLSSVLTDTREQTMWCINEHNKYKEVERNGAELLGIHLEGPFLNPEYKGAMPEHLLKENDIGLIEDYQEAAKGSIKYITIAPELDGIIDDIERLIELGMVVSIGHSGADYETAMKSIEKGVMSSTHTFNVMKLPHQHEPAISGAVLESDIFCEAICDGRHLHPGIVRLLIKTKGDDKVVGVTDSIAACGLRDGRYKLGINDVEVIDGDAKLVSNGARAGSTLTTIQALKNIMSFTNRSLADSIIFLTENPAKLIQIFDEKGSIALGKSGDIVVLNENYDVVDTFVKGKHVYSCE